MTSTDRLPIQSVAAGNWRHFLERREGDVTLPSPSCCLVFCVEGSEGTGYIPLNRPGTKMTGVESMEIRILVRIFIELTIVNELFWQHFESHLPECLQCADRVNQPVLNITF